MSTIHRMQLLQAREDLDSGIVYPPVEGNDYLIGLLGEKAVQAVTRDAKKRIKDAVAALPPLPAKPTKPELPPASEAYWEAVKRRPKEPVSDSSERVTKLGGSPAQKRHKRWGDKIASLVFRFEGLPQSEKDQFETREQRVGGYLLPEPKYLRLFEEHHELVSRRSACERVLYLEESKAAWIEGFDTALGKKTVGYKVGGIVKA